jgi:hypothetical protein
LGSSQSIILGDGWWFDAVVRKQCSGQCRGDKIP